MDSIINIGNTSYSIEDDWLKIAAHYFQLDQTSEYAVNLLKAGLFGYNNEIQSNEIKNAVYHRNVLYDEHFLNTASFPESIANFAKLYEVNIEMGKPSHMRINMAIKRDDILENPFKQEIEDPDDLSQNKKRVYELVLKNSHIFVIEQIKFLLPFPVQFIMKQNEMSDQYSITARYKIEDNDSFPFMPDNLNPYLKVWNENVDGFDYIFVGLDLFQLDTKSKIFSVSTNDVTENIFYYMDFVDQLAYLNVYYNYNGSKRKIECYLNNQYKPRDVNEYCYYTVVDDNTLQISFSADPNAFRPKLNSEIEIEIFTTKGSSGNFTYNGEIKVNFSNGSEFDKIPVQVTPITDATGGFDKLTNSEIKQKTIEEALGRRNIITDTDLEFFFNNFNIDTSINGSRVSFIKKRHDVLKRLISGYILLRDREKNLVPTNTAAHLLVSEDYIKNPFNLPHPGDSKGMICENTPVLYDFLNNQFFLYVDNKLSVTKNEYFIIDKTKEGLDIYLKPVEKEIGFFRNDMDDTKIEKIYFVSGSQLMYKELRINKAGNVIETITPSKMVSNNREKIIGHYATYIVAIDDDGNLVLGSKSYTSDPEDLVIYDITETSFRLNNKFVNEERYLIYTIPYVIKILDDPIYKTRYYKTSVSKNYATKFLNVNSLIEKPFIVNSIEFEKDSIQNLIYNITVELNTNLPIDEMVNVILRIVIKDSNDRYIGFLDMERDPNSYIFRGKLATDHDIINDDGKIKIIDSLYNVNGANIPSDIVSSVFLTEKINIELGVIYKDGQNSSKYGVFNNMTDLTEYATAIVYSTADPIVLFKNLDLYIESDIIPRQIFNEEDEEEVISSYFDLHQVPLIEYKYYQSRYNEVLNILDVYDDLIIDVIDRLENNDSLDMKFYNTHGASNYWVTLLNGTEYKKENYDFVDVTAIPLDFTIYTSKVIKDEDDIVVKQFISDFVEASNSSGLFAISNLLRALENSFDFIRYIEFGLVSNEETQKIFNSFTGFSDMTRQEIQDYVPEFLNIKKTLRDNILRNNEGEEVVVSTSYKHDINIVYK